MKDYHDKKCHAVWHNFSVDDVVFCANMKPNKLDSQFCPAKHVSIETKGRDTFTLVNVATQATLIRNAKYLKHAAKPEEVADTSIHKQDCSDSTSISTSETTQGLKMNHLVILHRLTRVKRV